MIERNTPEQDALYAHAMGMMTALHPTYWQEAWWEIGRGLEPVIAGTRSSCGPYAYLPGVNDRPMLLGLPVKWVDGGYLALLTVAGSMLAADPLGGAGGAICTNCLKPPDVVKEMVFFDYDQAVAICRGCNLIGVVGSPDPWVPIGRTDTSKRLTAIAHRLTVRTPSPTEEAEIRPISSAPFLVDDLDMDRLGRLDVAKVAAMFGIPEAYLWSRCVNDRPIPPCSLTGVATISQAKERPLEPAVITKYRDALKRTAPATDREQDWSATEIEAIDGIMQGMIAKAFAWADEYAKGPGASACTSSAGTVLPDRAETAPDPPAPSPDDERAAMERFFFGG